MSFSGLMTLRTFGMVGWICAVVGATSACDSAESSGGREDSGGSSSGGSAGSGKGGGAGSGGAANGGAAGSSSQVDYCGTWVARLRACGVLGTGRYAGCVNYGDAVEVCEAECLMEAECDVIADYFCDEDDELLDCYGACVGELPVTCDQTSYPYYYRCDGYEDCSDGSDEAGCPAGETFKCRNVDERVEYELFCDGDPDCSDASDEPPGCSATFTCDDDTEFPATYACDGFVDCSDGEDEGPDCAEATCG